jgi:hypothetical protein
MGCSPRYGDMQQWRDRAQARWEHKRERWERRMQRHWGGRHGFAPSGNRAFDEYRGEALRKLEEEAAEFREFLERLRMAKDRAEFDEFIKDRRNRPAGTGEGSQEPTPQPQS